MKRLLTLCLLILPLSIWAEDLVARKVFFEVMGDIPPMTVEILYSEISDLQPILVVDRSDEAHNRISIESADGLILSLYEDSVLIDQYESALNDLSDMPSVCREAALQWQDLLAMIPPEIDSTYLVEKQRILEQASFNRLITTPFQAVLWLPITFRLAMISDNGQTQSQIMWYGPFEANFIWYPGESLGLFTSLRIDFGDNRSFARTLADSRASTEYLTILPGIGVVLRSISRVSAEVGLTLSLGTVAITALEDTQQPTLSTGETGWFFIPVMDIFVNLNWNISEHWSMKFQIFNFEWSLYGWFQDSSPFDNSDMILTLLKVGGAYRW